MSSAGDERDASLGAEESLTHGDGASATSDRQTSSSSSSEKPRASSSSSGEEENMTHDKVEMEVVGETSQMEVVGETSQAKTSAECTPSMKSMGSGGYNQSFPLGHMVASSSTSFPGRECSVQQTRIISQSFGEPRLVSIGGVPTSGPLSLQAYVSQIVSSAGCIPPRAQVVKNVKYSSPPYTYVESPVMSTSHSMHRTHVPAQPTTTITVPAQPTTTITVPTPSASLWTPQPSPPIYSTLSPSLGPTTSSARESHATFAPYSNSNAIRRPVVPASAGAPTRIYNGIPIYPPVATVPTRPAAPLARMSTPALVTSVSHPTPILPQDNVIPAPTLLTIPADVKSTTSIHSRRSASHCSSSRKVTSMAASTMPKRKRAACCC